MESKRLIMRKFVETDFENYFQVIGNIQVMKLIRGEIFSLSDGKKRFDKIVLENQKNPNLGQFFVKSKDKNMFIGLGKIVLTQPNEAEIGYALLPQYWGNGYASEITKRLIEHGKTLDFLIRLIALTSPKNEASKRVLTKHNFEWYKSGEVENLATEFFKLSLKN